MIYWEVLGVCVGLGTFAILYTTFLFNRLDKSLDDKLKPIKELLTNHITDTTKKIDDLKAEIKEVRAEVKEVRAEIKADVREVRQDIKELLKRK